VPAGEALSGAAMFNAATFNALSFETEPRTKIPIISLVTATSPFSPQTGTASSHCKSIDPTGDI
jgi:hypothetical protein